MIVACRLVEVGHCSGVFAQRVSCQPSVITDNGIFVCDGGLEITGLDQGDAVINVREHECRSKPCRRDGVRQGQFHDP